MSALRHKVLWESILLYIWMFNVRNRCKSDNLRAPPERYISTNLFAQRNVCWEVYFDLNDIV